MEKIMTNHAASDLAMVPFISVDSLMRIALENGIENTISGIAGYVEQDFLRWESFDKTPRVASHSPVGVIELMPASDGQYPRRSS